MLKGNINNIKNSGDTLPILTEYPIVNDKMNKQLEIQPLMNVMESNRNSIKAIQQYHNRL